MKRRIFKNSAILRGLGRTADGLYDAMSKSAIGRALTSYDLERRDAEKSFIVTSVSSFYRRLGIGRLKRGFARASENSLLCEWIRGFFAKLLTTSVRNYGIFFLAFGFYGALMFLLTNYAIDRLPAVPFAHLAVDIGIMLAALPMLLSRKRFCSAIAESSLFNLLFFKLLGLRRESLPDAENASEINGSTSFIFGTFFGILTLVIPPLTILNVIAVVVMSYVILIMPESGMVLTAILVPFINSDALGYLLIYITCCYSFKLMRGKRTVVLDLKDHAILLFALVILLGGVFSLTTTISFTYSVKLVFYVLAYILTVNLIRSRRWLERIKAAFILSCVITAIVGIFQQIGISSTHFLSENAYLGTSVTAFFPSSEILAQYLSIGLFFTLAELIKNENAIRKLFMLLMSIAVLVCLYLTASPFVILAVLIASAIFFLICSNRTVFFILALLCVLPFAKYIAPPALNAAYERLMTIAGGQIAERIPVWQSSLSMASDYVLSGSGVGTYPVLFQSYVNETLSHAANASNLYLQTVIEIGIFGLIVFLIVIMLFIQHSFSLFATHGGGKKTIVSAAGVSAVIAIMLIGLVAHVWVDCRIFLCFWLAMGIATANGNIHTASLRGMDIYTVNGH